MKKENETELLFGETIPETEETARKTPVTRKRMARTSSINITEKKSILWQV